MVIYPYISPWVHFGDKGMYYLFMIVNINLLIHHYDNMLKVWLSRVKDTENMVGNSAVQILNGDYYHQTQTLRGKINIGDRDASLLEKLLNGKRISKWQNVAIIHR